MNKMPENMPADAEAAFAHFATVTTPSIDDFKLMVLLEASGLGLYAGLANAAPNDEIKDLLNRSGREELAHAHRVRRVIEKLSGEVFEVPEPADNPYYAEPDGSMLNAEFLEMLAQGEFGGEQMYEGWAAGVDDQEAAELLRQNGKEERMHGERARQIVGMLAG